MTSERLQRAHDLFDEALKRPAPERAAFIAQASGDDVELRAQVEALLEHDRQAGEDFMRPPESKSQAFQAALAAAEKRPDPLIGKHIGRYQVQSIIAVGGMGTVYEALQDQPRRTVALKVMNRNVASGSALRRFQFESQILAHLRHPNIAQIFEAGVHQFDPSRDHEGAVLTDAVPYFAMEYIPDAKLITQYAEEVRLDTRRRLELFAQVCDAVHHGHQKGVIHRDLKPANILIDSSGRPKVIDFGVARGTDADLSITTQQTQTGQFIGTMQYMSPEQCDADPHDLDTRSDVYSLGVVLYELLSGELPYDASKSTIYQATRVIKEESPRRLSAINPKLRGDVDTIVLKALEKDREKRYQSAADLAQDIRRHLRREPIEARPPTVWTKAVRWVARNPVVTTTVACLSIAAIVLGTTRVTVWFVNSRPHEIELLRRPSDKGYLAGYEVRLLARSGKILHTWAPRAIGGIRYAELVERPLGFGGGRLAVLAFSNTQKKYFPGALCAFDVDGDLEDPVWQGRIETNDILPELREKRGFVGEQFDLGMCQVFDVFPERPGREIVVVFNAGRHSQRVMRIYDLNGQVLYQVWHDGAMGQCYWMADVGLLVFAGDYHRPFWDSYGRLKGERVKAHVVFALRPKAGFISNDDWLPLKPGDDPLSPVWYWRLWSENAADIAKSITLEPPQPPNDPGCRVQYNVLVGEQTPHPSVWWVIDEFGNEVEIPKTRDSSEDYKRNLNEYPEGHPQRLPDPNDFHLGELSPPASPSVPPPDSPPADEDRP